METKNKTGIVAPLLRGDVYLVNLNPLTGNEAPKPRPAVIIQNDVGNRFSPITIVAPISWAKEILKPLPITIFLEKGEAGLEEECYIDCGQIRTVEKEERLLSKFGSLNKPRMLEVDKALKISLALE
jgi:mRNA interferase MazF